MNKIIDRLVKKYGTRDPVKIAKRMQIQLFYEPLGSVRGYYSTSHRIRTIHINSDIPEHMLRFVVAHELGHAVLHPKANTPFMQGFTYFVVDKYEIEANTFAVNLLVSDEMLLECQNMTIGQAACYFGIHEKMMELRIKDKNEVYDNFIISDNLDAYYDSHIKDKYNLEEL